MVISTELNLNWKYYNYKYEYIFLLFLKWFLYKIWLKITRYDLMKNNIPEF